MKKSQDLEITVDEWLQELQDMESPADQEGYFTVQELTDSWHICEQVVRKRLRIAANVGRLERIQIKRASPLNGILYTTSAYRLNKPAKKSKKVKK